MNLGDAGSSGRDAGYTKVVMSEVTDADRVRTKTFWDLLPNWFMVHRQAYNERGASVGGSVEPDFTKLGLTAAALFLIGKKVLKK